MNPDDRRLFAVLVAACFGAVVFGYSLFLYAQAIRQPSPYVQPSVPSLIPPNCDGRCNPAMASKPFNVVCPHCRSTFSVQPSATGAVAGAAAPPVK